MKARVRIWARIIRSHLQDIMRVAGRERRQAVALPHGPVPELHQAHDAAVLVVVRVKQEQPRVALGTALRCGVGVSDQVSVRVRAANGAWRLLTHGRSSYRGPHGLADTLLAADQCLLSAVAAHGCVWLSGDMHSTVSSTARIASFLVNGVCI